MKAQRTVWTILLITALLTVFIPAADAKGTVDRIIISGADLAEDLILTDRTYTEWLSMAALENFEAGPIEEPAGLGEGYTLERQFQTGPDRYQSFDRVVYYPDPGGDLGYVQYEGIVNGSSEYDGKWFRARQGADATMKMVLTGTLPQAYLMLLSHNGEIRVLDPATLREITTVDAADREGYWTYVQASAAGTALYYQHGPGPLQAQYRLDLVDQTNCRLVNESGIWMETLDGRILLYTTGSGQISVTDPYTAQQESTVRLPAENLTLNVAPNQSTIAGFGPHENGLRLVSVHLNNGGKWVESMVYRTDGFIQPVELWMTAWDSGGPVSRFYLTDGLTVIGFPFAHPDVLSETTLDYDDRAAVETGITATDLLGVYDGKLYLYHPMGRNVLTNIEAIEKGDVHRGIFVLDAEKGGQLAHWQPDLEIAAGTLSQDYLYAIHAPEGDAAAELIQLDIQTGVVVNTISLSSDNWDAALVRLNADALASLDAGELLATCPDAEPVGDVAEAVSAPTTP